MRTFLFVAIFLMSAATQAQTFLSPGVGPYRGGNRFVQQAALQDSSTQRKWFLTRYSALSTTYSVFKGGHATMVSLPVGLQLNRRLNDHLYAFGNVSIAPTFINFSRTLMTPGFSKQSFGNTPFNSRNLGLYSSASLGLMYVNTEKTFSISGSIGVERGNYPLLPYYHPPVMQTPAGNQSYR